MHSRTRLVRFLINIINHLNFWLYSFYIHSSYKKFINYRIINWVSIITKYDQRISPFININKSKIGDKSVGNRKINICSPTYWPKQRPVYYAKIDSKNIEVHSLDRCFLFPRSSLIVSQKNGVLLEYNFNESKELIFKDSFIKAVTGDLVVYKCRTSNVLRVKKGVSLLGKGSWNYFHMIFEYLPKLYILAEDISDYTLLVDSVYKEYNAFQLLVKKLFPGDITYVENNDSVFVEDLIYITTPLYLTFNKKCQYDIYDLSYNYRIIDWIIYLNRVIESDVVKRKLENNYGDKIFLTRRNIVRSYNFEEIEGCAVKMGFQIVELSKHSLLEQFVIMQGAKLFIGPTGASLTNLIFCKPNTIGITWMHGKWGNFPAYSTIAFLSNVNLFYLDVTSEDDEYHGNYYLDVAYFNESIKAIESEFLSMINEKQNHQPPQNP